MKAIHVLYLALAVAAGGCVQAEEPREWTAALKIVDDLGQPVSGAAVSIFYGVSPKLQSVDPGKITGLTDTNGLFAASHRDRTFGLRFLIEKPGYYPIDFHEDFHGEFTQEKLHPNMTLTLKAVGNPIPMYARRVETKVQKEDVAVGFDLIAGDWVAPNGKGQIADMLFTVHRKVLSESEYNAEVRLTFPAKGDGIAVAPTEPDTGSAFRTPRTAAEAGYEPERLWRYNTGVWPQFVSGYFFRVRTVLDQNGNVKSALYGKVRGDLRFYVGTQAPAAGLGFDYYLNPTPNDRNLEFDPKRNLLKGLAFDEQIREP